jgi:hypothetical protein
MIVTREILLAFRAAESCPPRMIDLDSDLLILRIEFDVTDRPWRGQAKNVPVEFFVLHWGVPFPEDSTITHSKPGWTSFCEKRPDPFDLTYEKET